MDKGWYPSGYDSCDNYELYLTTRPMNNEQEVVMFASNLGRGHYEICLGVLENDYSFADLFLSPCFAEIQSTNDTPSFRTAILAVDCLRECEEEIKRRANGKRRIIYIGAMDKRRMRAYQAIVNRYNLGYNKSSVREFFWDRDVFKLYKVIT